MRDYKNTTCGFTEKPCALDQCPVWIKLDDFEGCPMDIAEQAVKDFALKALKPLAARADTFTTLHTLLNTVLSKIPRPKG